MSGPVTRIRENVPQMLRDLPVWLLHDADKTPIYADGSNRRGTLDSAEDRARLVTFEEAAAALPQVTRASGLGFALGEVPGEEIHLAGLDFDGCYRDGELDERVMQILAAADSYAERSPSGIGLHIIGTGDIGTMKVNGAEIYSSGRYFTVTGNRINGAHVAEIREAAALARQLFGQATSPSDPRGSDGGVSADNDITEALKRTGLYLRDGGGGRHLIRCPWEARHSPNGDGSRQTSSSEAAYFAPGAVVRAETLENGMFRCQHAHCSDRRLKHLREYLGLETRAQSALPGDDREKLLSDLQGLALPTLNAIRTAETEAKIPIFSDLLYPGAWLIVGRPKIGKSWLLLQMTLAAAEGGQVLGYSAVAPIEVLYVAGEDDDGRIKARLEALGVVNAPAGVHVVNFQTLRTLAAKYANGLTFIEFLAAWLDQHPKVRLVLLDTETTCRQIWAGEMQDPGSSRITETDYRQTRDFDDLALRRKIVIGLVNHAAKRKGEWVDIHELINRSNTALAGCSGSIALADPPDVDQLQSESRMRVLGIRGRDLKDDILLAIRQREEMPYFENLGPYQEVKQTEMEQELLEALEELMPDTADDKYVTTTDLADELGKKRGTVQRAVSRMLKANRTRWKKYRLAVKRGKGGGVRLEAIA